MVKLTITKNDGNQRLDRFLKKYLKNAPLSYLYKLIRKDLKVNGKRAKAETMLAEGDELSLYIEPVSYTHLDVYKRQGVLYILDEPSIGLHQKDNEKLLATLRHLTDIGNTLIVVEHDEDTMYAADHIIDIGPGAGIHGGELVACLLYTSFCHRTFVCESDFVMVY